MQSRKGMGHGNKKSKRQKRKSRGNPKAEMLTNPRSGISKLAESDPSSKATCKKSILLISQEMVDSSFLDLEINQLEYGILKRGLVYLI